MAPRVSPAVLVGVLAAVLGGGAAMLLLPSALFGRAPAVSGTVVADAPDVAVVDGHTLRLNDMVVRLDGIAAPPRGRQCRDAAGDRWDCAAASSEALAGLVRGHVVSCTLNGRDRAGLPQGTCAAAGTDLNRALVRSGWARAENAVLGTEEAAARTGRRGLWRDGASPSF